ncbi:MAG: ATP-binding cassette domain-containing protein [Dokdonella sp.]|uniref:ATP-binding cassette domain-containing protein n=1 Tax=Dokdonella sp. TaxID=2291710 RepID=UPI003265CBFA
MFELDNVTLRHGDRAAIDAVSLAFPTGSVSAVIGSSGSGKSTLLRLLLGLELPDVGEVRIDDVPLQASDVLAVRRRIGYVIQDGGLFPHLGVRDNLALLPHMLGWSDARIDERADFLASLTHFPSDALRRFPAELSGGQRQRVALMRALMLDPPALLLDEPFCALDPIVRHELQDELAEIFRSLDKTVVLVTHDVAEAAFLASRLILLRDGRVVQDGCVDDFMERPADPFVSQFIAAQRQLPGRTR